MKPCGCLGHRSSQTARSPCNSVNSAGSVRLGWWGRYHMDLCGKVAVITGGKRIGRVVAQELAQHGMNLVLSYRGSREEAEQTAADVEAVGRRATIVNADVSKPADCLGIFDQALATFGRVDVLINMASIYRSKPLQEVTVDYWTTDLDVNLRSAFLCAHAAIPLM